ncbi:MAG: prenyltransferase/squalene oxidase repeat-containing protein [Gammaproteobacteria bacterium]
MKLFKPFFVLLVSSVISFSVPAADPIIDPDLKSKTTHAVDLGLHYLREHQAENGSWSNSVGVTALALRAFLESHRSYNEPDGPFITKPIKFILSHVKPNGAISETIQNESYNTAVAITALQAVNNPAYAEVIANGQKYLKGIQLDESKDYAPEHKYYGGIGYGGDERPDMSNEYMALEALKKTGVDPDDPVWQRALKFISRSQNNSETNDQAWAQNDGGFTYMPGYSPNGETNSYGGMTHAGMISLLFAGVDKSDSRVVAAHNWIKQNYTLDHNPGALKDQGLFYYYNAFAKSMFAYGEPEITDDNGIVHNWRNDLTAKLIGLQASDGSWVNETTRWWEGDKNLVTAWSVIALNYATTESP